MRIARALIPAVGRRPVAVAVMGETAVELPVVTATPDPVAALLAGRVALPELAQAARRRHGAGQGVHPVAGIRVLSPLARPGKIVAIGLNYRDHTAETGLTPPAEPLTFAKYPTSVIGPGEQIRVPATVTQQVDWEAELAVVIGTPCGPSRRGTLADLAGYTVANDVSARDLQFRDGQWTRGKSLDTFCPLGPVLMTPDEINDPQDLDIWCSVNGESMQKASTADMIFSVAALLDFLTATVTLEPGDVILTGTPPGVGGFRTPPVYLSDGDVVTVGLEGIGELTNPVVQV